MVFDGLSINLELWDTAGQEGYKQIRPLAYTNVRSLNLIDYSKLILKQSIYIINFYLILQTDVFIVCYDVTNKTSLDNVKKEWIPELNNYCRVSFAL